MAAEQERKKKLNRWDTDHLKWRTKRVYVRYCLIWMWCWKRVLQEWRRPAAEEEEDEQETGRQTGGQTGGQTGFFKASIIYILMTPVCEPTAFSVFLSAASCLFVTLQHQTSSCWLPWQQSRLEGCSHSTGTVVSIVLRGVTLLYDLTQFISLLLKETQRTFCFGVWVFYFDGTDFL